MTDDEDDEEKSWTRWTAIDDANDNVMEKGRSTVKLFTENRTCTMIMTEDD